jgi:protein SCO1
MPNITRRNVLAISAAASATGLIYAHRLAARLPDGPDPATSTPHQLHVRKMLQERYFPNVPVVTQDGKKVRFYDDLIKDKIVVISIFYSHCQEACPRINRNLEKAQELLGDLMGREVFFVSMTIKPEEDTPHELRKYAKTFHAGPGWTFVTGKPGDIELLRRSMRFVDPDPVRDKDKSRHSGMLRIGNEPYTIWSMAQAQARPDVISEAVKGTIIHSTALAGAAVGSACKAAART